MVRCTSQSVYRAVPNCILYAVISILILLFKWEGRYYAWPPRPRLVNSITSDLLLVFSPFLSSKRKRLSIVIYLFFFFFRWLFLFQTETIFGRVRTKRGKKDEVWFVLLLPPCLYISCVWFHFHSQSKILGSFLSFFHVEKAYIEGLRDNRNNEAERQRWETSNPAEHLIIQRWDETCIDEKERNRKHTQLKIRGLPW